MLFAIHKTFAVLSGNFTLGILDVGIQYGKEINNHKLIVLSAASKNITSDALCIWNKAEKYSDVIDGAFSEKYSKSIEYNARLIQQVL